MSSFAAAARAATARIREVFSPTPLLHNAYLSARYGADIWIKREDLTPVRSYKLRGAFNAMSKLRQARPDQQNFVCASAGNHAQGVAFACRHFGVRGTIFMPVTTPEQKIMKTRAFGGENVEIRLVGDYFDDTLAASQAFCAEVGGHFLAPFDDDDVIEGQASVAVEILDQLQDEAGRLPDVIVVPVGGGGLSAGVLGVLRELAPGTELWLTEPAGGASLTAALKAGEPVTLGRVDNFVDGAAVARIGSKPFRVLAGVPVDHVLAVPENRLCGTLLDLLNVEGIVLEPAGALSVDALKDLGEAIRGKTVVCIASGGNFDFERLPEVKERAQRYAGVKKYYLLRLPQRPGALKDFLGLLGPEDDVARFEYLKKSARNFGTILIGIETGRPQNFVDLEDRMSGSGLTFTDITQDQTLSEFVI